MAQIDLFSGETLDYDAYAKLQKEAFAELLAKLKVSNNYMTPDYYRWKYATPFGSALIAVVRRGQEFLACNAMIPLQIRFSNAIVGSWQLCDAATHPVARRRGYFLACSKALRESLRPNEILFGFPNKNSLFTLVKQGWREIGLVTTWVSPSFLPARNLHEHVTDVAQFGSEQDILSEQLAQSAEIMLDRRATYLNWRYVRNPSCKYSCFVYRDGGEQQGFVVVREAEALGRKVVLVMDLWGLRPAIQVTLLRHAAWWARQQRKHTVLLDSGLSAWEGTRAGFIPIWSRLLPKRQVLMGCATPGRHSTTAMSTSWRVQTGDWDSF
jgi:hypothetical protein